MLGPFLLFKLALSVPKCECPLALGLLAMTLSKVGLSYSARCHSTSPQKDLLCHHPPRAPPLRDAYEYYNYYGYYYCCISLSPSQIFMDAIPHKSLRIMSHKEMLPRFLPLQWPPPPMWPLSPRFWRSLAPSLARRG